MKKGSKATIVVPSKLGYGSKARNKDMPAYTPLVFDMELVDVEQFDGLTVGWIDFLDGNQVMTNND